MNKMINKRGVSQIIVFVILVGFAITIVIFVMNWSTKYTKDVTQSGVEMVEESLECGKVKISVEDLSDGGCSNLLIKNNGYLKLSKVVTRGVNGNKLEVIPVVALEDKEIGCKEKSIIIDCNFPEGFDSGSVETGNYIIDILPGEETSKIIEEIPCIPECDGKQCGPDSCGDFCGTCGENSDCILESGNCLCDEGYSDCNDDLSDGCECYTGGESLCYQERCCLPDTCDSLSYTCGSYDDECGGTIVCGDCPGDCFGCEQGICQVKCEYCTSFQTCEYSMDGCYYDWYNSQCNSCEEEYWYDLIDKNCDGVEGFFGWEYASNREGSHLTNNVKKDVLAEEETAVEIFNHIKGRLINFDAKFEELDGPLKYTDISIWIGLPRVAPPEVEHLYFYGEESFLEISNNLIVMTNGYDLASYSPAVILNDGCSSCATWSGATWPGDWNQGEWVEGASLRLESYGAPYKEKEFRIQPTQLKKSEVVDNWYFKYTYINEPGTAPQVYEIMDREDPPYGGEIMDCLFHMDCMSDFCG